MNQFVLKTKQDIEDFVRGCTFFGTGGGGSPKDGIETLTASLEKGHKLTLMNFDEIKDDDMFCSAFFMGSIAPKDEKILAEMKKNGFGEQKYDPCEMLVKAIEILEEYAGVKVRALFAAELGGSNTPCCLAAAYEKGIEVVDADCVGRAIPEMCQGLPAILSKSFLPVAYFDAWGNSSITTHANGYPTIERLGKYISEASYGCMAEAAYLMTGKDVKEILIRDTCSQSYYLGKAIRNAVETGQDPIAAAIKEIDGILICKGKVEKKETDDREGYYWGTYTISGINEFAGNTYKMWFKNENHVVWENDIPIATSPDIITAVYLKNGEPMTNTNLVEGEEIALIGMKARKEYLDDRAMAVLSPRALGFDFDYTPLVKKEK